jgi:hypothetical protein
VTVDLALAMVRRVIGELEAGEGPKASVTDLATERAKRGG